MDSSNLYTRERSHFIVEFSDGDEYNSFESNGGEGRVCYGVIFSTASGYEDEYGDDQLRGTLLGISSLIVYHNPDWLLDRELTEFVLSEEMFGKAFLDTDLDKGLKEGFEMNVNLPYHYLLGAMITLRHTFSHPYFVETWRGCYDICKDKLHALFYADRFRKNSSYSNDTYTLSRRNLAYDHCIFPGYFSVRDLHFPTLDEGGIPSSESLDLGDETFWMGVWGEGTRKPVVNIYAPAERFENNPEGYEKLIKDEENY